MAPKPGSRGLGIAASDAAERSQLCGAVVRADRVVDDLVFETCTTGGSDATAACCRLVDSLERPDVQWILLAGIAPAWFNIVDIASLAAHADRPVVAVGFEHSDGLEGPLREHFDGKALRQRLERYRGLPPRHRISVDGNELFVRAVGVDFAEAAEIIRGFVPASGGRPEPLRVARLGARAGRAFYLDERNTEG